MKIKKFLFLCLLLAFFVFLSAGWDFIQEKEPTPEEKVMANTAKLTAMFSEGTIEDMVTTLYNKDAVIYLPREEWLKKKGASEEIFRFWAPLMKMFPDGKVKGHDMIIKFWKALREIGVKKIAFETVSLSVVNEVGNHSFKYSFIQGKGGNLEDQGGNGGGIWVHRQECPWELITQYF